MKLICCAAATHSRAGKPIFLQKGTCSSHSRALRLINGSSSMMVEEAVGKLMSGWPRFGSVRLRFGDGTVRAVPVFGSGGSSKERVLLRARKKTIN